MLGRVIGASRYLILLAVVAIFTATLLLLVYGGAQTVLLVREALGAGVSSKGAKTMLLSVIEVVDLFLLATARA